MLYNIIVISVILSITYNYIQGVYKVCSHLLYGNSLKLWKIAKYACFSSFWTKI